MECHEAEAAQPHAEPDADDKDKQQMEGPTVHAGALTMVDPGKPSEKVVGGHAMESGGETKQAMSNEIKHQRAEMERMKAQLAKFEADRALTEANKAIDAAWSAGRLVPLHAGETEAQTKARFLKKYQTSKQLFEADLAPGGNACGRRVADQSAADLQWAAVQLRARWFVAGHWQPPARRGDHRPRPGTVSQEQGHDQCPSGQAGLHGKPAS